MERSIRNKIFLVGFISVSVLLGLFGLERLRPQQEFGAIVPTQAARYTLFTTSTLSTSYTGGASVSTTGRLSKSLVNMVLAGFYQSNTTGARALLLVERSIDDGLTYQPYQTITPETADVLINTSGTGTSIGSPFVVPGTGASTSGTVIGFSADLTLAADYIRVSAKEVSSSTGSTVTTPGTLTAKVLFQSL